MILSFGGRPGHLIRGEEIEKKAALLVERGAWLQVDLRNNVAWVEVMRLSGPGQLDMVAHGFAEMLVMHADDGLLYPIVDVRAAALGEAIDRAVTKAYREIIEIHVIPPRRQSS